MLDEIRNMIEESNGTSTSSSNSSIKSTGKQVSSNGDIRSHSVQPHIRSQARPTDELHLNTNSSNGVLPSQAIDPLIARFSQLRTTQAAAQKKLPYPIDDSFSYISPQVSYANKDSLSSPPQPGIVSRNDRLSGPRPQSTSSTSLPPHPPKLPLNSRINTSLPRAPSPIYSPARNIAAPTSIEPPRTSARSTIGALGKVPRSPLNGMALPNGDARPDDKLRSRLPELPRSSRVTAQELHGLFRHYDILVIDVRTRDLFDEGHIFAKYVVCIEPLSLQHGLSFDELLEKNLIYSPEPELDMLNRIPSYDLVVIHDQKTPSERFIRGSPHTTSAPSLRALYDCLTEFNYNKSLVRAPVVLVGGLDAWIDVFGSQALQNSKTLNIPLSQQAPKSSKRPPRVSINGGNSSRDVKERRLRDHQFLNADEERAWREKARNEEVEPVNIRDLQPDSEDEPIHNINEFFRRFPEASAIPASMISPRQDLPAPRQHFSGAPSLPPPIVSRPSYSGVSERERSQLSPSSRQPTSAQPPLYTSNAHPSLKLPRAGLHNMGQTCYMNATIQCLLATIPLSLLFLDDTWKKLVQRNKIGSDGVMPSHFSNLIRRLWKQEEKVHRPSTFRNLCARFKPEWGSDRQQDGYEFCAWLIDLLHEDLNVRFMRTPLKELTPEQESVRQSLPVSTVSQTEWDRWSHKNLSQISAIFAGQLVSRLRCDTCSNISRTYDTFFSLEVEIPQTGTSSLTDCLASYCQEERLTGDEAWMCPVCKCQREATKRLTIGRLPRVLVINFKRFTASIKKIHTPIDFPLHGLNMAPYMADTRPPATKGAGQDEPGDVAVTPPFNYDAYAVMRHIGPTLGSGHYMAMVKDTARNTWVKYNDGEWNEFDPAKLAYRDRLQNDQAYIVFYERARAR